MKNHVSNKKFHVLLLALLLVFSSFTSVWANEAPMPDFSPWALEDLNEGERYGLFDPSWYYDGFRDQITTERADMILSGIEERLEALGYERTAVETYLIPEMPLARGEFLTQLYNILEKFGLELDGTPEEYFTKMGVLRGTGTGNALDAPCTSEHGVIFGTRLVEAVYNEQDAGSRGFMWLAEKGGNKVYLLGSIHIGDNLVYPVDNSIKEAFGESQALYVEANLFDQSGGMEYFMEKSMYQDGTSIRDHIPAELHEKVIKALELYGIPYEAYSTFKPWSLANNLNAIHTSNSDSLEDGQQAAMLGIDLYFMTKAMLMGMPIVELEGIAFQADMFDGLSKKVQEMYLESIVDAILDPTDEGDEEQDLLKEWLIQWQKGDHESFTESYTDSMEEEDEISRELTMMLFGERDENMANKIMELLDAKGEATYFLVVGAGHFTVENSIIDRLQASGYNVQYIAK
jgi:uncharacterized protein YbaP (TraB family)